MTRLDRLPIRAKIAAACAMLSAATVLVFAVGTLVNVYHEQIEAADLELAEEAWHIENIVVSDESARTRIRAARVDYVEPWVAFAVIAHDGSVWRSSDSLPEEVVRSTYPAGKPQTIRLRSGSWRAKSFAVGEENVVVTVNLEEVHDIVADLILAYVLALPFVGLVAGFGGWWVAGWALHPVRQVTHTAAEIRAENLSARVPVPPSHDEIAHLAQVLNAMLSRLERSFEQAERFAADASHELRTPLTILRGEIEALLRDEVIPERAEQRLVSLQEEVDRLERITGNLLLLARLDAGAGLTETRPVDFSAIVAEACEDLEPLMASRDVRLETDLAPGATMSGDDALLRRIVFNLLENAAKFNTAGGLVRIGLGVARQSIHLTVENTGPGIPRALRARVFDRFFRVNAARVRAGHGLGLGLAREIARAHGGDVVLDESAPEGWTRFVARLPAAAAVDVAR